MASSREYLEYVLECLGEREGIGYRPMMGEYLLYCRGKMVGGIYDDRLLVKITPASLRLLPDASRELPYPGAKEMLLVEEMETRGFLQQLFFAMTEDIKAKKKS